MVMVVLRLLSKEWSAQSWFNEVNRRSEGRREGWQEYIGGAASLMMQIRWHWHEAVKSSNIQPLRLSLTVQARRDNRRRGMTTSAADWATLGKTLTYQVDEKSDGVCSNVLARWGYRSFNS